MPIDPAVGAEVQWYGRQVEKLRGNRQSLIHLAQVLPVTTEKYLVSFVRCFATGKSYARIHWHILFLLPWLNVANNQREIMIRKTLLFPASAQFDCLSFAHLLWCVLCRDEFDLNVFFFFLIYLYVYFGHNTQTHIDWKGLREERRNQISFSACKRRAACTQIINKF